MFKRVLLFIATNVLVVMTISIIISALGIKPYLLQHGIDYQQLAIFCVIWGMVGAFISLLMSKFIAKMAMGVVVIDPQHATREEQVLLDIIYSLAHKAKLPKMPEVGIYQSPEVNAFATGPSKSNALVAVSSGLLGNMNRDEIDGVLGHEISHIANGDMVTMTLLQGVINSFVMFFSRILAYGLSLALSRSDDQENNFSYLSYALFTMIFDLLFTLLGSVLVAAFSRWREYRADEDGARLAGRQQMIAALRRLQSVTSLEDTQTSPVAAFKISHHASWIELLASHPPLEKRIERLQHLSS